MTVERYAKLCNVKVESAGEQSKDIATGYAGDFLSHVMGGAPAGSVWFTVMNNVNVAAVAHLTECAAVVICDGIAPDTLLIKRCRQQNINLFSTPLQVYAACAELSMAMAREQDI